MVKYHLKLRLQDAIKKAGEKDDTYIFTFGKYRGKRITWVIDEDPYYIEWLEKVSTSFNLSPELKQQIIDSKFCLDNLFSEITMKLRKEWNS